MAKEEIIRIVKDKDDFKNVIEIKENASGVPAISVKVRSDGSAKDAGDEALKEYKRMKGELAK